MIYSGIGVSSGYTSGKAYYLNTSNIVSEHTFKGKEVELDRYKKAIERAEIELDELYEKTLSSLGEESAGIIEVQKLLLQDIDYIESVENYISEGLSAENAILNTSNEQALIFDQMDDEYMKARAVDIKDIAIRLNRILSGKDKQYELKEKSIILADNLTPSETCELDRSLVLAFVVKEGSSTSHTAILARIMGIPAVIQSKLPLSSELNGKTLYVDGTSGDVLVDPTCDELTAFNKKRDEFIQQESELECFRNRETRTKDGKKIHLYANIGSFEDVDLLLKGDAEGVGLLRSEFLYLSRDNEPSEDELFKSYKDILTKLENRRCIIRTLDIGADKQCSYISQEYEENPALGVRGIRLCFVKQELFRRQLRAILRATKYGNVGIMFPMITSEEETLKVKELLKEIESELISEGHEVGEYELGVMVETPSAAICADMIAPHVDFLSVGTNDLIQYTLASDRQNANLSYLQDVHNKAILRLLKNISVEGHKNGCWVGICGEAASDLTITEELIRYGYDEFSVSPPLVLKLRKKISMI